MVSSLAPLGWLKHFSHCRLAETLQPKQLERHAWHDKRKGKHMNVVTMVGLFCVVVVVMLA
jgi:hypothetical protein